MNDTAKNQKWDFLERPNVPMLDVILGKPMPVLDHGFVRLIDYMGDEAAIVQAARVSYGKGTKTASDDRGLLRYLLRHHHTTPFEMCEIKVHMKLPIFVARQWIRHRTANVNEYSARYSILANEFFVPHPEEIEPQSKTNKQGREGELPEDMRIGMARTIQQHSEGSYQIYEELMHGWPWVDATGHPWPENQFKPGAVWPDLDTLIPEAHAGEQGMARELARMVLPVNAYTEWYWKVDLHNLLHLLRLRTDPHAQKEIRAYANVLADFVVMWVPRVWDAFEDYQLYAETFSRQEMEALKKMVSYCPETIEIAENTPGLSKREIAEFLRKLDTDAP